MVVGILILAFVAVLVPVLATLCANGTIPRNGFIGIRLPATMASEEGWARGHRAAVVPTVVGAALGVVAAIVALTVPDLDALGVLLVLAGIVVGIAWAAVAASRAGR